MNLSEDKDVKMIQASESTVQYTFDKIISNAELDVKNFPHEIFENIFNE
jgi:hypothetical protein